MKKNTFFCIITAFYFTNLKAQAVSTFIETSNYGISGLTIEGNFLYASSFEGKVYKADYTLNNSTYETFTTNSQSDNGICKIGNYIYVANYNAGKIERFIPNIGTIVTENVINVANPFGLTHRNSELYISSKDKIYKMDLSSTNPTLIQIASNIQGNGWLNGTIGLKVYDNFLYVAETNGISKINLDSGNYEKETITTYTGWSFTRGSNSNTFYLTNNNVSSTAIYELNIQTQTYSLLIEIPNFIGTFDIVFADNSLFVTTLEGDSNKVAQIDLNPLSINDFHKNNTLIFPNPASDYISVNGIEPNESVTIINPNGQIVKSAKVENNIINISDLDRSLFH